MQQPLPKMKNMTQAPLNGTYSFGGGLNNTYPEQQVDRSEVVDGQNMWLDRAGGAYNRSGVTRVNQLMGSTTGILNTWYFAPLTGSAVELMAYNTKLYYDNAGVWTAIATATIDATKRPEGCLFPYNNKFYILDGGQSNNVVKISNGTPPTADQTDASFKKGTGVGSFNDRLLVWGVSGQENYVWASDAGADTFSANSYFRCKGKVVNCIQISQQLCVIITDRGVEKISGFQGTLDGTASSAPTSVYQVSAASGSFQYGSAAQRSAILVGNMVYWIGLDSQNNAEILSTDGTTVYRVGNQKIKNYLSGINTAQVSNACAVKDGRFYRFAVTPTGASTNTREYIYDTLLNTTPALVPSYFASLGTWQTEFRPAFPINSYCEIKSGGATIIHAGNQSVGQVVKINTGMYDELLDQQYASPQNDTITIDGLLGKRGAQGFQLSGTALQTHLVYEVALLLQKTSGTTTELILRIETDNGGVPSGTLADVAATTTLAAFTDTPYIFKTFTFATPFSLAGATKYWLVLRHTTELSGNSVYAWGADSSSPTYSLGTTATYASSTSSSVLTFNPGSSVSSRPTALDGWIGYQPGFGSATTFSSLRNSTFGLSFYDTSSQLPVSIQSDTVSNNWTDLSKALLYFDTTTIPANATITAATLSLHISQIYDVFSQSLNITAITPNASSFILSSDYDPALADSTRFTTDATLSSLSNNAYNTFTLNSSGRAAITKAGITNFVARLSCDIDNSSPTWQSGAFGAVYIDSIESGINTAPRLFVTFSTPSGVYSWTAVAGKVQNFGIYTQESIESWVTKTIDHDLPQYRKKPNVVEVEGSSTNGITAQLGIGLEGKDSAFNQTTLQLNGKTSVWSSSSTDTTTGHLVWDNGKWSSNSSIYSLSPFVSGYLQPARWITYRFYYKGIGNFRINSFLPFAEIIPTNL